MKNCGRIPFEPDSRTAQSFREPSRENQVLSWTVILDRLPTPPLHFNNNTQSCITSNVPNKTQHHNTLNVLSPSNNNPNNNASDPYVPTSACQVSLLDNNKLQKLPLPRLTLLNNAYLNNPHKISNPRNTPVDELGRNQAPTQQQQNTAEVTLTPRRVTFSTSTAQQFSATTPHFRHIPPSPDETLDFRAAREQQVVEMTACPRTLLPKAMAVPWPRASDKMLATFSARHAAFKTFSEGYMSTQARMLWLLSSADFFADFEKECYKRALAPSTALGYWITFVGLYKMLFSNVPPEIPRITKLLKARNSVFQPLFPTPLTASTLTRILTKYGTLLPLECAMLALAWTLGQRMGDVAQLARADLRVKADLLLITFRRGKVISTGRSQPFTLALSSSLYPASWLIPNILEVQHPAPLFLVSLTNASDERSAFLSTISTMMAEMDERLELRSVRRGGLQAAASHGFSLEEVRLLSHHATTEMLLRYLNWGEESPAQMSTISTMTNLNATTLQITPALP